jgi:hypothetical protein
MLKKSTIYTFLCTSTTVDSDFGVCETNVGILLFIGTGIVGVIGVGVIGIGVDVVIGVDFIK